MKKMRPIHYWGLIFILLCVISTNAYFKTQASPELLASSATPKILPASPPKDTQTKNELYIGMSRVSPAKIRQLFPEAAHKPLLVMFHSKFCHDCKRMKPVIEKLVPQHPELVFKSFDILEDKKRYQQVFSAFKPVSVPILVFINKKGTIQQVLYNYQKPAVVEAQINAISKK